MKRLKQTRILLKTLLFSLSLFIFQTTLGETCPPASSVHMKNMRWSANSSGAAGNYMQYADTSYITPIEMGKTFNKTNKPEVSIHFVGAFWWGFASHMVCIYNLQESKTGMAIPISLTGAVKIYHLDHDSLGPGWSCMGKPNNPSSCSCDAQSDIHDCQFTALFTKKMPHP